MTMTTEEAVTALQASCLPCELAAAREEMSVPDMEDTQKWEGVLTYEGQNTGDGRLIQPNALSWDTLPIPLRWVQSDVGGHDGAVVVGRINEIERHDDGAIYAFGDFDLGSEAGREAARQVERGLTPGVSVDLDTVSFEVRVASEASEFMNEEVELAAEEPDEDGRVKVAAQGPDDELMITTGARIRAATLVAIPAFEPSRIALAAASVDKHGKWHSPLNGQYIDMPSAILGRLFESIGDSLAGRKGSETHKHLMLADQASKAAERHEVGSKEFGEKFKQVQNEMYLAQGAASDAKLPQIRDQIVSAKAEIAEFNDAREALLDSPDFDPVTGKLVGEDEGFPAGQNPDVTYPPNPVMEDFLIEKGYERDVVDSLTDEELRADYENEGGDLGDEGYPTGQNPSVTYPPNPIMEDFLIEKGYERDVVDSLTDEELRADFENEGGLDLNEELDEEERAAQDAEDAEIKTVGDFMPGVVDEISRKNSIKSEDELKGMSYEEIRAEYERVSESNALDHQVGEPNEEMDQYELLIRRIMAQKSPEDNALSEEAEEFFNWLGDIPEFNWVEDTGTGHLPQYIKRIAKHLKTKGMTEGHAIATAVNAVKKMCATGDINFPGKQQVNVGSQAEACEAVAEWEAKKAQAKADAAETEEFRDVSPAERERLAEEGEALSDGSFPIANCDDLKNAIQAIGRAKDPAAARAHIKKRAGELDCDVELPESITAAAFPLQPPSAWFADPGLDGPTPLKVTPDGRVYGHLAVWGTCHTAFPGQCVTPPTSPSNYSYFRTGSVYTAEGTEQNTGVITMDTLHAGKSLSAVSTLAHYEHTGRAIADVNAGEDAYGIWVAGALRPGATDDQVRALRGAPLSGDWRKIGSSGLELVAALAVNVPGFPIPRPQGLAAGGAMQALVAAGMLAPTPPTRAARRNQRKSLSDEDYAYLKRLADRERALVEAETAQMAREVLASDLASSIGL